LVHLQPIIEEALRLLRQTLPSTIEIRQHVDAGCPRVAANGTQIHQVVVNLCTNAAHAMRLRGGVLDVRLDHVRLSADDALISPGLGAGAYARLTVRDTGGGISPDDRQRIFEPYFSTKQKGEGTGLGLAVVHGIVHGHGGAIVVDSQLGEGSSFSAYFPIALASASVHPEPSPSMVPRGSERILCVDDEPLVARALSRALTSLGYTVTIAPTATTALELLRADAGAFDLLLTDQTMPGLTGTELAEEARALRAELAIVLCTGNREWVDARRARHLGMELLDKPVEKATLADAVRSALDRAAERISEPG
jgi:CheY-like chemotaxis protein